MIEPLQMTSSGKGNSPNSAKGLATYPTGGTRSISCGRCANGWTYANWRSEVVSRNSPACYRRQFDIIIHTKPIRMSASKEAVASFQYIRRRLLGYIREWILTSLRGRRRFCQVFQDGRRSIGRSRSISSMICSVSIMWARAAVSVSRNQTKMNAHML